MVIEENEKANYLAHFKTKGAKNGIRRFQSYMVAPNPSGATGVEIGEAAEQRARIHGDSDDNQQQTYKSAKELRKEARRQKKLQKIAAKRKKKEQGDKEKWAKSYRELRKHSDAFTNEELRRAIERLELEDRITGASLNSVRDKTQKGADILKNLDSAGRSMAGIYNTVAGGLNVYHEITGKGQKLPKFRGGNESIQIKKPDDKNKKNRNNQNNSSQRTDNNRNQDNNSQQHQNGHGHYSYKGEHTDELREDARRYSYDMNQFNKQYSKDHPELPRNWKTNNLQPYPEGLSSTSGSDLSYLRKRLKDKMIRHDALDRISEHLEHHGVKGQSWFTRHFQSYKTAPTRSGKVGVEVGLAAKQAERNGEGVDTDEVFKKEIAEYKDLVNKKLIETEHDVGWRDKMSKDHRDSVDLGMNALERMGRYDFGFEEHYRDETEDNKQFLRDWFVFEDQTIGMFTIANMVRKGATKQQINRIIDTAEEAYDSKFNEETGHYESKHGEEYEYLPGVFQLAEGNWDDRLRSFANACFEELESEKK